MDGKNIGFKDESFDLVMLFQAAIYQEKWDDIIRNSQKILKNKGYLFITFNYESEVKKLESLLEPYMIGKIEDKGKY